MFPRRSPQARQSTDAIIILVIVAMSVGLGFFNEYRSLRVAELDQRLRRAAIALRDGNATVVDAASLVPGDVIALRLEISFRRHTTDRPKPPV